MYSIDQYQGRREGCQVAVGPAPCLLSNATVSSFPSLYRSTDPVQRASFSSSKASTQIERMSIVAPLLHLYGLPSLDSTFGSIYLGIIVGGMLYGLTIHQAYRYFRHYPEDDCFYPKGVVLLILTFETLHTILWTYIGYRYLVSEAFDVGGSLRSHWTITATFIITPCSLHACQGSVRTRYVYH
ncbi:hypothetical protein C8Q70DRAFT_1015384 [Cubamyces menziesii]|nr:hypothetical protein C8Q70DRAFT_1015384 [Cubamyces menziesii]